MTTETVCIIEEWTDVEPYTKIKTITPAFLDMSYAINQVEDLVFLQLQELNKNSRLSDKEFTEAISSIPYKWLTQPGSAAHMHVFMHNQPQLENVYTVCQLPVLDTKLSDINIQ